MNAGTAYMRIVGAVLHNSGLTDLGWYAKCKILCEGIFVFKA